MTQRKMLYLLPAIAWTGISISVYAGLLTPIISQTLHGMGENEKLMKSFMAMISLGVGEIVGGLLTGHIIDKIGNRLASMLFLASLIT
jgi:MFS family permease